MKKILTSVAACFVLFSSRGFPLSPAEAWDPAKQRDLGQDSVQMQWYLLDYGAKDGDVPFAITRKYYTNTSIKQETVGLLMSKYGLEPDAAGSLYYTEYEYEYTKDGKQFAVTYLRHHDMLGKEIYGTVYDGSTDAAKKNFALVDPNTVPGKAKDFVFPKPPAPPTPSRRR